MIIRDADINDFNDLERMGIAFARAAGLPDVDTDTLYQSVENLIQNGILKVAVNGTVCGCTGALVFPHYWCSNELIAQELFLWISPEARGSSAAIRLLSELEKTAKKLGAKKLLMLCLENLEPDKVERFYLKLGYKPLERTFEKCL